MAVYDGVPSIRLEGDEGRALALIPEAKALLYKVQTFKQRAGVGTFSMSRRVDDDSYIYVLSAGDQNLIHISVAPHSTDVTYETPPVEGVMPLTMLSGMVVRGYIEEQPSPSGTYLAAGLFYPTSTCQRMNKLPAGGQFLQRLDVTPHPSMGELGNPKPQPIYSQYTKLRPSMYSGKMQKVVQAVMGLGRMPGPMLRDMQQQGVRSTYVDEIRANGVRVLYDYKHQRTHGITVASDGRLWLVEISITRGVLAMPLPIYPDSDTQSFRAKFEARGDEDIVAVLDELGGFPTGESFPSDAATLNKRLARGDVLRLLHPDDLADFYSASPYSTALGWAFSPDGSEAHNTGYYYGEDGYQRGIWWQINLKIGAINPNWVPGEGPIAQATATPRRMGEGFLYSDWNVAPTNPRAYLPFKTHQPGYGLLSHSARPLGNLPPVFCDTAVHVCFINGELHVVRFYRNPRTYSHDDIEDDRPPDGCLYNGQWRIVDRRGERGIPPMMYSNREDPRRVAHAQITETDITSTDLGFGPPRYSDMILYPQYAYVFRHRHFKNVWNTVTRQGEGLVCAVSVPEYAREAYYMAYGEYVTAQTTSRTTSYESLLDPNQGCSWRCLAGFGEGGLPGVPLNPPPAQMHDCPRIPMSA